MARAAGDFAVPWPAFALLLAIGAVGLATGVRFAWASCWAWGEGAANGGLQWRALSWRVLHAVAGRWCGCAPVQRNAATQT
eukprot:4318349-Prymnesium_polylepis.1